MKVVVVTTFSSFKKLLPPPLKLPAHRHLQERVAVVVVENKLWVKKNKGKKLDRLIPRNNDSFLKASIPQSLLRDAASSIPQILCSSVLRPGSLPDNIPLR